MALLRESVEAKKFDVRVIEKNVAREIITFDDVTKEIGALPDEADEGEWISLDSFSKGADEERERTAPDGGERSASPSND